MFYLKIRYKHVTFFAVKTTVRAAPSGPQSELGIQQCYYNNSINLKTSILMPLDIFYSLILITSVVFIVFKLN